jgi:glucokinase
MILAGDIGGTKTRMGLFDDSLRPLRHETFLSREYSGLEVVVESFLRTLGGYKPSRACFGIAGPVREGRCETSNLPWVVESVELKKLIEISSVLLINDLESIAYGIALLTDESLLTLNPGVKMTGNRAVIAAGTGLGEAFLFWDGKDHRPAPSEGGHTEFGPRTELEVELWRFLHREFGHVSYERIVSGPGLYNVYRFLRDTGRAPEPDWLAERIGEGDPAAEISGAALAGESELAAKALRMFVAVYGAEAGNLALKGMAVGGVYVAGGIAPKILPAITDGTFMKAFVDKGRFENVTREMPVCVVLDKDTGLKGAARRASLIG